MAPAGGSWGRNLPGGAQRGLASGSGKNKAEGGTSDAQPDWDGRVLFASRRVLAMTVLGCEEECVFRERPPRQRLLLL